MCSHIGLHNVQPRGHKVYIRMAFACSDKRAPTPQEKVCVVVIPTVNARPLGAYGVEDHGPPGRRESERPAAG